MGRLVGWAAGAVVDGEEGGMAWGRVAERQEEEVGTWAALREG